MLFFRAIMRSRRFAALWLALYAVAGLLAHSPLAHVHCRESADLVSWRHVPAAAGSEQVAHAASDHASSSGCSHGHRHAHHGHVHRLAHPSRHSDKREATSPATPLGDSVSSHHLPHDHLEECAGCLWLGSVSSSCPVVTQLEGEPVCFGAPLVDVSFSPIATRGAHPARAPPAL